MIMIYMLNIMLNKTRWSDLQFSQVTRTTTHTVTTPSDIWRRDYTTQWRISYQRVRSVLGYDYNWIIAFQH